MSKAGWVQPVSAGVLASVVGFASTFTLVLQGLTAMGATPLQAASGLAAICLIKGLVGLVLCWRWRLPVAVAWSTPGAALLIATGTLPGGFAEAVGAFLVTAALIVTAGLWRRLADWVAAIPPALASAMLAGILLNLCLAPLRALQTLPLEAGAILVTWLIAWRFARLYAVPLALVTTVVAIALTVPLPAGSFADAGPHLEWVMPSFSLQAVIGVAIPLFLVTMAAQNLPGLAVMTSNGYRLPVRPVFVATGAASGVIALFGGLTINLAAITAALCAGPEAHPDPARRWIAGVTGAVGYVVLGLGAGLAAAFIAAAPPVLIQAVAGLALLGSLGGALAGALAREAERIPAILTFVTTASGLTVAGIGSPFWGLVFGGAAMALAGWRSAP
ncbi:MAG: benzoate transporter BenE [Alphaproteobacteria bacterium]|nr:MAG: benzoate transporter BenE [Alphaproteobacteria bacterium]